MLLSSLGVSYQWNHMTHVFSVRLPSLSIMFSGCIHAVARGSTSSFLWLSNIPLCGWATFYSSIPQFMYIRLFPTFDYYE